MRPKKVVLVVDADDIRVAVRRLILRTKGYEVHSVASLDLAMQEIIRRSPDVILCDAAIEGSTGEEFSRRVKKRYPNTPILLTSDRCKSPPNVIANVFLPAQSGPDVLLRMVKKFSAKNLGSKPKTAISARKEAIA